MPPIDWDESFAIGHMEIDRQHREYLDIINEIENLLLSSNVNKRHYCANILKRLLDFTNRHFRLEMKLMQEYQYAQADASKHWRSHKIFDDKIYLLYRQALTNKFVSHSSLLKEVQENFFNHIQKEDKLIIQSLSSAIPHLNEQELEIASSI